LKILFTLQTIASVTAAITACLAAGATSHRIHFQQHKRFKAKSFTNLEKTQRSLFGRKHHTVPDALQRNKKKLQKNGKYEHSLLREAPAIC